MFLEKWFYGGKAIAPHERICVNCFVESLSLELREIVSDQISHIVYVQRQNPMRTMFCYEDAQPLGKELLVPDRSDDRRAARVCLQFANSRLNATVLFGGGRMWGLLFNRSTKNLIGLEPTCRAVKVLVDLSRSEMLSKEKDPLGGALLSRINGQFPVREVLTPVSKKEREDFLSALDCKVPADFKSLLRETNGFAVEGWTFYGTRARETPQPDSNLILTFENEIGNTALCFKEGDNTGTVYNIDQIGEELTKVGKSYTDAIIWRLSTPDENA